MAYAFQAEGLVKRFRKTTAWPGSTWPPAGYGPWGARAERRGQDDGDPHPGHAAAPGRRTRRGGRAGRRPARAPGAPADRPHRAVRLGRRGPHRRGEPHPHRGAARPARRRGEGPGRRAAGPVRADRGSRAASLVGNPRVIFLDEPTTGLDPGKREDVWRMIRLLTADGGTVLLTTQYLKEAAALADEIAVIHHGTVIAHGTAAELKEIVGGQTIVARPKDTGRLGDVAAIIGAVAGREPRSATRGVLTVPVDGDAAFADAVRRLAAAEIEMAELGLRLPSLDEVFFTLTGQPTHEHDQQGHDPKGRAA